LLLFFAALALHVRAFICGLCVTVFASFTYFSTDNNCLSDYQSINLSADHLIYLTSADASVPRLAGFSLIT
jgi:hypothetical protein